MDVEAVARTPSRKFQYTAKGAPKLPGLMAVDSGAMPRISGSDVTAAADPTPGRENIRRWPG